MNDSDSEMNCLTEHSKIKDSEFCGRMEQSEIRVEFKTNIVQQIIRLERQIKEMARQEDKKKRKNCSLCADKVESIDYKDAAKLKRYLTEAGKIIPRRITGNCAAHQRMIAKAIKKAREAAIISYVFD